MRLSPGMEQCSKQQSIRSRTAQRRERRRKAKHVSSVESSNFFLMEIVTAKRRAALPNGTTTSNIAGRHAILQQAHGLNVQYRPDAQEKTKGPAIARQALGCWPPTSR